MREVPQFPELGGGEEDMPAIGGEKEMVNIFYILIHDYMYVITKGIYNYQCTCTCTYMYMYVCTCMYVLYTTCIHVQCTCMCVH